MRVDFDKYRDKFYKLVHTLDHNDEDLWVVSVKFMEKPLTGKTAEEVLNKFMELCES